MHNETGVTSDQVRKDFSEFDIKGNKRGGYDINKLLETMEKLFHRNKDNNIVLIGMGNMGLALSKYSKFSQRNMNIVATFDIDPFKQKIRSGIPVYSMDRLKEIIERFNVKVAILAVPEISAQQVTDELMRYGITGIMNFAPVLLKVPDDVIINNVNLCDELESVIYYVHKQTKSIGLKNLEHIIQGYEILISGLVQGVGFRPFICRMAAKHGLFGEVENRTNGVSVMVQGDRIKIDLFSNDIVQNAPPASHIKSIEINPVQLSAYNNFKIVGSKDVDNQITEISPDIAVCQECLDDLLNDTGRIDYPFVNCTNCGPRFTIIEGLPYDRPMTTMKNFGMCIKCNSEYNDILDRRFHAQPIACNLCGPLYLYEDSEKRLESIKQIIEVVSEKITSGKTIAIKGLGGYHLMCDALNNKAVKELRKRKHRDLKPFAVMFRDISAVKKYCFVDEPEASELTSWRRPIVILKHREELSAGVSNGLNTTGAMLPYMPFHYMLFRTLMTPAVVLTSGNISDEPVIIDDFIAKEKLKVSY